MDITDTVKDAALYGLKFAAEKERLPLYSVREDWIAGVVATHAIKAAISTGQVVDKTVHDAAVEKLKSRARQFENYWASTKVQADQQLQRIQSALMELKDQDLAASLAEKIGVILPDEEAAA
jgi:predicted RNA-binding protein with PUA-like domain